MIAVVGEALIDAHLDGDVLRPFAGGGPFNTAVALARLGAPACFLGAISDDRFGRLLEETLRSAGVETDHVLRVQVPTPIAIVDPTPPEPHFSFYLGGTAHEALGTRTLDELPRRVEALHVGTLALATDPPASAVVELAEREARKRVLMIDPNIRPGVIADRDGYLERLERLCRVADLVKLSTSDISWLYPGRAEGDVSARLLERGAGCVVLTRGAQGAEAWTSSGTVEVPAPQVTVVDTVGAGDAFGAGLLVWLWRSGRLARPSLRALGMTELEAALRYAAAVAAAQCTRASAWGPTEADVEPLLTGHAPKGKSDGLARVR